MIDYVELAVDDLEQASSMTLSKPRTYQSLEWGHTSPASRGHQIRWGGFAPSCWRPFPVRPLARVNARMAAPTSPIAPLRARP